MKRYDFVQVNACYTTDHQMEPSEDGEWVRFEDIPALPAEDRAVTAPPVPPPADARWFPDPPPGPRRAVTAPQEQGVPEPRFILRENAQLRAEATKQANRAIEAETQLSALTHAIEALRGRIEQLPVGVWKGREVVMRSELTAILKGTKQEI